METARVDDKASWLKKPLITGFWVPQISFWKYLDVTSHPTFQCQGWGGEFRQSGHMLPDV